VAPHLDAFEIALPDGFRSVPAERGLVFRGAAGEELSISEAALRGEAPEAQRQMLRDRLVQGGIKDIQRAACQPDLEVVVPLARAPGAPGLETWNLVARSAAGRLFAQAVVASDDAVAVLTFEGTTTRESIERWFGILGSVRAG
jgi:hypothetical protein